MIQPVDKNSSRLWKIYGWAPWLIFVILATREERSGGLWLEANPGQ
jgi:hypothetical protein